MRYVEKDFSRCLVNPLAKGALSTNKIIEGVWPVDYEPADNDPNVYDKEFNELLIRYVAAMYDPESPLLKEPELAQRKTDAATLAGYDLQRHAVFLEDELYNCKNEYCLHVASKYLQLRKSREFAGLMADEQTFWEFVKRLMEPISKAEKETDIMRALEIKTKLSEAKEVINQRLTQNWKQFFADDETMVRQAFKTNVFTPEAMAGII